MLKFRILFSALTLLFFCLPAIRAQGYTISTVAGDYSAGAGYSGDGGPATSAQLDGPAGIAVDSSGNIYVADALNDVVRVISGGNINTFAGDNTAGYSGDTKQAINAELNSPVGIAVDSQGNVYIADSANNVIRKVTTAGIISTYAGDQSEGSGYGGDGGLATQATMATPTGLAMDSAGNLYIADSVNGVIRQVRASNQYIYSLAGAGVTGELLLSPEGVAVDPSGNLYITDTGDYRIVEYANNALTTLAGNYVAGFAGDNGPAVNAKLNDPLGLIRDAAGNIYFADTNNFRIRRISPDGIITTIAGTRSPGYSGDGGPATSAQLYFPKYLAMDKSGNIYVSDSTNNVIRMLTPPPAPSISANGVGNAASYVTQLAPGSLATLYGADLSLSDVSGAVAAGAPLGTMLNDVTVTVNGVAAPVLYASPNIVNFQVPYETAPGPATITVSANGATSNSITVPVTATSPGIFLLPNGPAVENANYSLNTASNPAAAGSTIVVFVTGLGAVLPAVADGAVTPATGLTTANATYSATIGTENAQVSFAGLTPGSFALGQVNIQVPSDLAPGSYPLVVTVGGQASNAVTISVN